MRIVEYSIRAIAPGSLELGVLVPIRVLFMGIIDLFKNYLFSIGPCGKKALKKQLNKKCKYVWTINTFRYKINRDGFGFFV